MAIKNTQEIYKFLDVVVNPLQRSIVRQATEVHLSKKSFDLLMVLLQRSGELITKDEILNKVWPNQIITESALNKQITKLRKIFDVDGSEKSSIETIRGVGIRWVVDVHKSQINPNQKSKTNSSIKMLIAVGLLLLISYVLYQYSLPTLTDNNEIFISKMPATEKKQSIKIVVVPAEKTDEWLDIGGLNYLSELLQQHQKIDSISPQFEWFNHQKTNVLALQLSQSENIDYALIINHIMLQDEFVAKLTLRNNSKIISSSDLKAISLTLLFKQIDAWVMQQLEAISDIKLSKATEKFELSDFELQSYLRGITFLQSQKYSKAAQLFETAVNQNQSFYPAWLKLAEAEAELGNFQKSLAITETIAGLPDFEASYLSDLYNVKARVLIYLNKFEMAEVLILKSIKLSEQQNNKKSLIDALANKVKLDDRMGVTQETLNILNQQLNLVQKHYPLPESLGKLNHNLAIIHQNFNNFDTALSHIDQAIQQFEALANYNALVSSYNVKSNIYNILGETGQSLLVLEKAQEWLPKVDSIIAKAIYFRRKATNLYEQGYRIQAKQEVKRLMDLSVDHQIIEAKIMALIVQAEMGITYKNFDQARQTTNQLLEIVTANPSSFPTYADYILVLDMYLSACMDNAKVARTKMNDYLNSYPGLSESLKQYLPRIEAPIIAKEGFNKKAISMLEQLMQIKITNRQILEASYIGYEILDLQWQQDMDAYFKTLNRIQEITNFKYPIHKYRAKYLAHKNDFINAAILMKELKPKAREFWTDRDQILLEEYQRKTL